MASADRISITVCGDGGCGKSSITLRLVRSEWTHEYDPTIEDSYSVTRVIDGLTYHLSLTDTAGQEEYRGLWASSNLKSDAFLLVYDITNAHSLDALEHFTQMIDIETEQRLDDAGVPPVKIVAGNKCDLKDGRVISSRQGLEWARKRGCGFMETSAREMVNIEETFALLVRRVVEARRLQASGAVYSQSHHAAQQTYTPSRTQHIPPMTEKQQPLDEYDRSNRPDGRGRSGKARFWARLRCW